MSKAKATWLYLLLLSSQASWSRSCLEGKLTVQACENSLSLNSEGFIKFTGAKTVDIRSCLPLQQCQVDGTCYLFSGKAIVEHARTRRHPNQLPQSIGRADAINSYLTHNGYDFKVSEENVESELNGRLDGGKTQEAIPSLLTSEDHGVGLQYRALFDEENSPYKEAFWSFREAREDYLRGGPGKNRIKLYNEMLELYNEIIATGEKRLAELQEDLKKVKSDKGSEYNQKIVTIIERQIQTTSENLKKDKAKHQKMVEEHKDFSDQKKLQQRVDNAGAACRQKQFEVANQILSNMCHGIPTGLGPEARDVSLEQYGSSTGLHAVTAVGFRRGSDDRAEIIVADPNGGYNYINLDIPCVLRETTTLFNPGEYGYESAGSYYDSNSGQWVSTPPGPMAIEIGTKSTGGLPQKDNH